MAYQTALLLMSPIVIVCQNDETPMGVFACR